MSVPLRTVLLGWAGILGVIFLGVRSCLATPEDAVAAARRARARQACGIEPAIRKLFSKVELKTASCPPAAGYDYWGAHGPVYTARGRP